MENLKYKQTFENNYSGPKKLLFVAYLMKGVVESTSFSVLFVSLLLIRKIRLKTEQMTISAPDFKSIRIRSMYLESGSHCLQLWLLADYLIVCHHVWQNIWNKKLRYLGQHDLNIKVSHEILSSTCIGRGGMFEETPRLSSL